MNPSALFGASREGDTDDFRTPELNTDYVAINSCSPSGNFFDAVRFQVCDVYSPALACRLF
jgi:hypothetical protein